MKMIPGMIRVLLALGLLVWLSGCASVGGSISGQVRDVDTGESIAGAHVVYTWSGDRPYPYDAVSDCFRIDVTRTDADGKYRLLPWAQLDGVYPLMDNYYSWVVYKPGYEEVVLPRGQQTLGVDTLKKIDQATVDPNARQKYLLHILGHTNCGDMVSMREKLIPFYRDLYHEALNYSQQKGGENQLRWIKQALVYRWNKSIPSSQKEDYFKSEVEVQLQ
jgi:hypothetical protein